MNKMLMWGSVVVGVFLIIIAVVYFITPAGSLPVMMPGFEANSTHIHFKHGLGSLILGLGLFAFAWFTGAPKKAV